MDKQKVLRIWSQIEKRFEQISQEENVSIRGKATRGNDPALTDPAIQNDIRAAARAAGLSIMDLPSGAGHDAQQIARLAPIGMIFVPSRGGLSHSALEYTQPEDVFAGRSLRLPFYRPEPISVIRLHGTLLRIRVPEACLRI